MSGPAELEAAEEEPQPPRKRALSIADLNPYLTCILCGGYFVDATCIAECLHSFCRACLVRYLENNACCPVCDVAIHRSKLHKVIRPDRTLQTLTYKLVPGLYQNEMKRRKDFYASLGDSGVSASQTTSADRGEGHPHLYTPDEPISLCLAYDDPTLSASEKEQTSGELPPKRYFKCPAALTIQHLKKFLALKFDLPPKFMVEMWSGNHYLTDDLKLMDVAYILTWTREEPMLLNYRMTRKSPRLKGKSHHSLQENKDQKEDKKEEENKHTSSTSNVKNDDNEKESLDSSTKELPSDDSKPMEVDSSRSLEEEAPKDEEHLKTTTSLLCEKPSDQTTTLQEKQPSHHQMSKQCEEASVNQSSLSVDTQKPPNNNVDAPEVEEDSGHDSPGSSLDKSPVVSPQPDLMDTLTATQPPPPPPPPPPPSVPAPPPASRSNPLEPQSDVLDLTVSKPAGEGAIYSRKRPVPNPPVLNRHRLPAQITRHPSFPIMPTFRPTSPAYLQPFLHQPHHLPKRSKTVASALMPVLPLHPFSSMNSIPPHIKVPQIQNRISKLEQHKLLLKSSEGKTRSPTMSPSKTSLISAAHHSSHSPSTNAAPLPVSHHSSLTITPLHPSLPVSHHSSLPASHHSSLSGSLSSTVTPHPSLSVPRHPGLPATNLPTSQHNNQAGITSKSISSSYAPTSHTSTSHSSSGQNTTSSHKGYSRFKGSNLMVINPDPTSSRPKIVIKNMSPRPH